MGDTAVMFHRLSFVPDGEDVVVGRVDADSYVVLPADGAALLRKLVDGATPDHAARWYDDTFGEQVDMDDFLAMLRESGFVRDGAATETGPPARVPLQWLGRVAFSPLAWLAYTIIFAVWLRTALDHHDLRPRPENTFYTGSLLVVQLSMIVGQLPLAMLHESFHALAGRRLGLRSRLDISNRYMYVVFETRMNGLLSVPRRQRYLPFAAGMVYDVVAFCALGLLADATRNPAGELTLTGRFALALAFTVLLRIGWQFQLYLRTDLYYVLATALGCHDLHDASTALLRNRIWRLLRRPHRVVDEDRWTERDRRVGRLYGPFIVLGVLTMIMISVLATIPVLVRYVQIATGHMTGSPLTLSFWDGALPLVITTCWFGLPVYLARRKRRQDRRRSQVLVEKVS